MEHRTQSRRAWAGGIFFFLRVIGSTGKNHQQHAARPLEKVVSLFAKVAP